jgi:hypothetical protein
MLSNHVKQRGVEALRAPTSLWRLSSLALKLLDALLYSRELLL